MKKFYSFSVLTLIGLFLSLDSNAQINITNGSDTICHDTLFDSGGSSGNYANSEDFEYTISPTGVSTITINISSFSLGTGDVLEIHDGPSSASSVLFKITDTSVVNPGSITTTGSDVTFHFVSDASVVSTGWKMNWVGNLTTTPSVSISASANSICTGDAVTFTVTDSTGGGYNPSFKWRVGSTDVGTDFKEFVSSSLGDQDTVYVIMTQGSCPQPMYKVQASDEIITLVDSTPNVTISVSKDPSCTTDTITFSVTDSSFAGNPSFAWTVGGSPVGGNSHIFTHTSPANNDNVAVTMTAEGGGCYTSPTDVDNIIISVTTSVTASVSISADDPSVCNGTNITFTAAPTNGGGTPVYAWRLNGSPVGSNSSTYANSSLSDMDWVAVSMTSSIGTGCVIDQTSADSMQVTIYTDSTPNVAISVSKDPSCTTDTITFSVTDSSFAGDPSFAWTVGGSPVGGNSHIFTHTSPANNDNVAVTMTAEAGGCYTSPTDVDNIIISVTTSVTASVSVSADDPSVCDGTNVTFTATPTNGGGTPVYAWTLNGSPVGSNSPTYANSSLIDGAYVAVWMTSSIATGCVIDQTSGDSVLMNINPNPSLSIGSAVNLDCRDVLDGSADANGSGGTGTLSYLWSSTETTEIATALDSGYNVVVVTDDSSCTDTDSILLSSPAQLDISFIVVHASGFGLSDGSVTATASGGIFINNPGINNDGYMHKWSNAGAPVGPKYTTDITVGAGWYSNTITDDNGCTYIDSELVTQPDILLGGEIRKDGLTSDALCDKEIVGQMTESTASTGGIGAKTYTWQFSSNLLNWNSYLSSDSINFTLIDSIQQNTFIRRRVVDTSPDSAFSNIIFLNYIAPATVNINGLGASYCTNDDSVSLFGSPSGGKFNYAAWIDTTANKFIPALANASDSGISNSVGYTYTDINGCVSNGNTSTIVYLIDTGQVWCLNPADTTPQNVFDVDDTTAYWLWSTYPGSGTFSGTGVYNVGPNWYYEPSISGTQYAQDIIYSNTNANGCTSTDTISVQVLATQIELTSDYTGLTNEFSSCYTTTADSIYAIVPPTETVTQYRWIAQDQATGRLILEYSDIHFTVGSFSNVKIPFPFDPKQFKPISNGTAPILYDSSGVTPLGVTHLRIYFQHYTVANPFFTNLIRPDFELTHMGSVSQSANTLNSNGTIGTPFQYCESETQIDFTATLLTLPATRTVSKVYSLTPPLGSALTDNNDGTAEFYPDMVGGYTPLELSMVYTDVATGCSVSSSDSIFVDSLPNVTLNLLPDTICSNDGVVSFYGDPYAINKGTFSSPTWAALYGTHINGNATATIIADSSNIGNHDMKYIFQDPVSGCVDSVEQAFEIYDLPELELDIALAGNFNDPHVCISDNSEIVVTGTVNSGIPGSTGDSITGPGITYPYLSSDGLATFNPSVAGVGTHSIKFHYQDALGCNTFIEQFITVNGLPSASFTTIGNDYEACNIAADVINFDTTSLSNGYSSFSILGNSVDAFRPVVNTDITFGLNKVVNNFIDTATTCENTDSIYIFVNNFPVVSISGIDSTYCHNDAAISFIGSPASPGLGGFGPSYFYSPPSDLNFTTTLSLPGQNSGSAIADSTNVGWIEISYNYTDSSTGCFNGDTMDIHIRDIPVLMLERRADPLQPLAHCLGDTVHYKKYANGIEDMNVESYLVGPGFADSTLDVFDPDLAGVGVHTVTYKSTDASGCYNEIDSTIEVLATADASFTMSDSVICNDSGATLSLAPLNIGGDFYYHTLSPKFGLDTMTFYVDSAVIDSNFVAYVYDDGSNCNDTVIKYVVVNELPYATISGFAVNYDYCLGQDQHTLYVDKPSLGQSYFRSYYEDGSFVKTFNNMLDSGLLTSGVDSIQFTPMAVNGTDTVIDDWVSLEYVHTDINGCTSVNRDALYINSLPQTSISMIDTIGGSPFTSDGNVCALQEKVTLNGLVNSVPGLPNGYFYGSSLGMTYSLVSTNTNSLGEYGYVPLDSFLTDTVYYHYTDGIGCRNTAFKTLNIKRLPPSDFSIVTGPNVGPKNVCPYDVGLTNSFYDNCPLCISTYWPSGNLTRTWEVNGNAAFADKKFTPGSEVLEIKGQWNHITQEMEDTRWSPGCVTTSIDSFFLDTLPIVDVIVDDVYCSNQGVVTFKGSPASAYGVGVGVPSVFSSPNMFNSGGGFTNSLNATGLDSIVLSLDTLFAKSGGGQEQNYDIEYEYTDPNTNCAASASESFRFRTKPKLKISSLKTTFCPYDAVIQVNLDANTVPATGVGDSITGAGISGPIGSGSVNYDPSVFSGDTTSTRDVLTYYHTDSAGCSNVDTTAFLVRSQPVLNLIIDPNLVRQDSVCFDDAAANLIIQYWDTNSNSFSNYGALTGQSHPTDPSYFEFEGTPGSYVQPYLSPISKLFSPKWDSKNDTDGVVTSIRFTGTYFPDGGCLASIYDTIVTHPKPIAKFYLDGVCSKYAPTMIGDSSIFDIPNFSPSDGILSYIWEVDGDLATVVDNPGDTLSSYTKGNALSPGNHDFALKVKSIKGCLSDQLTKKILFVDAPDAEFSWNMDKECFGQTVTFDASATETPDLNATYTFDFGEGIPVSGPDSIVTHTYTGAQKFTVILEVGDTECRDSAVKDIYIRPVFDQKWQYPFHDGFDSAYSGWVPWVNAFDANEIDTLPPTSFVWGDNRNVGIVKSISGNNAWYLSYVDTMNSYPQYLNSAQTSLIGPCFGFSGDSITKPMILLNSIYNIEQNDGFVVQFTTDRDKPLEDVKWINIGEYYRDNQNSHYETGIDWYTKDNIFGNPGGQTDAQGKIGWTQFSSDTSNNTPLKWIESRHEIDTVKGEGYVRFRIAFGSNSEQRGEGFIIDDFRIAERKKHVVFEAFTNSSNDLFFNIMNNYDKNIIPRLPDALDIQYHTSFPGTDPMNVDNASDPSARSVYYSVSSVPYVYGDGNKYSDFISSNSLNEVALKPRALEDPKFKVNMNFNESTSMLQTTITALSEDFQTNGADVSLHIALIENKISNTEFDKNSISTLFGTVGYQFTNVLKRMYPTAAGTSYTMFKGDSKSLSTAIKFDNFYSDPTDKTTYKIIAFVQDRNTKEIYQANWVGGNRTNTVGEPEYNGLVNDGVEYTLYPNPTQGLTYMSFNSELENSYELNIYNQVGVLVNSEIIPSGTKQHSFDINGLTPGMYFIMLNDGTHEVAIKKLMLTK